MAEFTEDWFSDAGCGVLAELVALTNFSGGRVVEVGCWEGKSTIAIANAAYPTRVEAVDTWAGSPGEVSSELAAERNVLARFVANVASDTKGNVIIVKKDWRTYFAENSDPIRFCHIDASHTYEEVRDNISAVAELLLDGGIVCGDDVHHLPVWQAVMDVLGPEAKTWGHLWCYQKAA